MPSLSDCSTTMAMDSTNRSSLINAMLLRAWRERWDDAQWGTYVKTVSGYCFNCDRWLIAAAMWSQMIIMWWFENLGVAERCLRRCIRFGRKYSSASCCRFRCKQIGAIISSSFIMLTPDFSCCCYQANFQIRWLRSTILFDCTTGFRRFDYKWINLPVCIWKNTSNLSWLKHSKWFILPFILERKKKKSVFRAHYSIYSNGWYKYFQLY